VPAKYLITGGAGFIGSHLTDRLAGRGHDVTVLDDLSSGSARNLEAAMAGGRVRLVVGSVLDSELVGRCVRDVDACIHLAAALGVQRIVDRPLEALLANVRGADIVMAESNAARSRVLFASSSEVYGKQSGEGLTEQADCRIGAPSYSRWSYAIAKQFGEALANAYRQDANAAVATVRFFNIVGARQSSAYGMVLPRFAAQALADEPVTIYGDGRQSRCFTSVHDAVDAIEALLGVTGSAAHGTFNVGTSAAVCVEDLARLVISRAASQSTIVHVPYAEAYGAGYQELGNRVPDTGALHELVGWKPRRTIEQMIDEVIASQLRAMLDASPPARLRRGNSLPTGVGAGRPLEPARPGGGASAAVAE
jgi:UDP-glucose 4-epimerase